MRFVRLGPVPKFKVTIENEEFSSCEEYDCADELSARKHAIAGVVAIGGEQIAAGKPFFGAHVRIENGQEQLRLIVSLGASPLKS